MNKLNIYACSGLEAQQQFQGGGNSFSTNEAGVQVKTDVIIDNDDPGFSLTDGGNGLWSGTEQNQVDTDTEFTQEPDNNGLWAGTEQTQEEESTEFTQDTDGNGLWATGEQSREEDPEFEIVDNGNGLWASMNKGKYDRYENPGFYLTDQELWASTQVKEDLEMSGWQTNETLRYYLGSSKDGGCAEYFLYIFIPENEVLKYSAAVNRKRPLQLKTYKYVLALFTELGYGTESEMREIIRNGIESAFETSVEDVLDGIRTGKREAIGPVLSSTIIAAIISAVVSVVLAVVTGVIEYCKTKAAAKYTAPTYEELSSSVPEDTDILGYSGKGSNGWLWLAAGVGAVLFFLGKKK